MEDFVKLFKKVNKYDYKTVGDAVSYKFERKKDKLYIYFQPSLEYQDWINNFSFGKKPYKGMGISYKVHGGFLKCWNQVKDIIGNKINDLTIKKIVIVGYSHGAALACLCHEYCWFNRPDIRSDIRTFAFEAPRVYAGFKVKKELRERWAKCFIIRNDSDIVTHVPPKIFGFTHVGNIIEIGRYRKCGLIKSHTPEEILISLEEAFN